MSECATEKNVSIQGDHAPELVILTGMSGAGRTEAIHALEDFGYYCIDNLPPRLFGDLLTLKGMPGQPDGMQRIAVVSDARSLDFFNDLKAELSQLDTLGVRYQLIFLDASDEKLVARYKSSRRRHPLCADGGTIGEGIIKERKLLADFKDAAHEVIDTSDMLPQMLRSKIRSLFNQGEERDALAVSVYSFGFKHGAALDADIVIDVRFLPNPYYDERLRPLTGLDQEVCDYVMHQEETAEFLRTWHALLGCVMPAYVKEGKQQLAIAIGCTGGQHRSVALAEETGSFLKLKGYRVSIAHRDLSLANTGLNAQASVLPVSKKHQDEVGV